MAARVIDASPMLEIDVVDAHVHGWTWLEVERAGHGSGAE
jgi:hypothetical protein